MRGIRAGVAVIAMALTTGMAGSADAQTQCTASGAPDSCPLPGSVSMTAGRVVRLQMSGGTTSLTAPTPADFDAGFNSSAGPTLTVSANAPWNLHIRAATANWTATNTAADAPAWTAKPAGDLRWSVAPTGPFAALTTSDANLFGGSATAAGATTLYFRTLYDWANDTPGNYSLAIVLTLTSP